MTRRTGCFDVEQTVADVEGRVAARFPAAPPDVVHGEAVIAVERYAKDFIEIIAERDALAAVGRTRERG